MKFSNRIYRLLASFSIIVCTSHSVAQVNLDTAAQELVTKAQTSPDATIDYDEYKFVLGIDKFRVLVDLLNDQFQASQLEIESVLNFITTNSAPMREGWSNHFRVKDGIAYNVRKRLYSFDTVDLVFATMAMEMGSDYSNLPNPSKEAIWWDSNRSVVVIDDQVVLDSPREISTIPLGDLDRSYLPWGRILGPEGYLEGQTIATQVSEDNICMITFTVRAGTPSAYCASESFDMNRNWRPIRSWNHTPGDTDSFINREYVWMYSSETEQPKLSYECVVTPTGDVKVTLRVFSSWLESCSTIDLRLPPRYAYISPENSNEPVFHEVGYLESVQPEDKLLVAFIKVTGDFGQNNPESDFVVDGIIDEKDVERILLNLAITPPAE